MRIRVKGAREHNLKDVDIEIGDGLTVVTGVSGSGKTSLVFDTIYQEARRRFEEVFSHSRTGPRLTPPRVDSITGLGPAVAVGQNLLNRNPNSTLATASGLHPFLRLLYARLGARHCPICEEKIQVVAGDQLIERIRSLNIVQPVTVHVPLLRNAVGSHRALLGLLEGEFGSKALLVDGEEWNNRNLNPGEPHSLEVKVAELMVRSPATAVREALEKARSMGADAVKIRTGHETYTFSTAPVCSNCGYWLKELRPQYFNRTCPHCGGDGCEACHSTGLQPEASTVTYAGLKLPELLALSVDEAAQILDKHSPLDSAYRLRDEIAKRLEALGRVGLGYLSLDRPSPSLSRGESQRVRLAVAITSRLEDVLHVLDEPTIGQHPHDVSRLLPAFRELGGPVLYVEHDRLAAAEADSAVEIGPGAGVEGGEIMFTGTPQELWDSDTATGRYFSLRERVKIPEGGLPPNLFITVQGASAHNLRDIAFKVPLGRLSVVTGVSGSGKSTLVEDVLVASLRSEEPTGCEAIDGPRLKPVLVDQSPIGRNPRSTPATYTKLSDTVRDLYAERTGMSPSHFSFNRPEGACPACGGMGAVEVKMRYLPSTWVTCTECEGRRYNDDVLGAKVSLGNKTLSIADFYELSIAEASRVLMEADLDPKRRRRFGGILRALTDIGLGYLSLGQSSPTLSGGEAQRVKLAKYLGHGKLRDRLIVLDEPSTGLHPKDINGLLVVLDRLVKRGATVVVVEHNTDIIRAADWIIDLGPGAGPKGGEVLYMGDYSGLDTCVSSLTARALREEDQLVPRSSPSDLRASADYIAVRGARANNLRDVDVDFPKNSLTVVTGVSGCGKSSLVSDTLEAEARRRYLETLSLYERQGTKEGPEAPVDGITGLGVTIGIAPERWVYNRRSTVGTVTEIFHHLSAILSVEGERNCLECGSKMARGSEWACPLCGTTAPLAPPRRFNPRTYAAACLTCNGVGSLQRPRPEKLITHPEKPLCGGAMHSPGFFPQGFLCKPGNSGYDIVQAFAARHGFDPTTTPWKRIPDEVRQMFLYGDPKPLEVTFRSHTGRVTTRNITFRGFYAWIGDWDVGGTYTENVVCPTCNGARLRPEYLAVTIGGSNIHQLCDMPLDELKETLDSLKLMSGIADHNLRTARRRLRFLCMVGLGYINLNRIAGTLSAGEAQRVRLAGLLGSGVTSLTVLLDEPTRGIHPGEVHALLDALQELRDEGNTVIVVEHDPDIIRKADHVIDVGPGPGAAGGLIVAQGNPEEIAETNTSTGRWLRATSRSVTWTRRRPKRWMTVEGARENNLKAETIQIPLGVLVGFCGVSGSGKSTLMIDTVGRALSPEKQTTSVAREPFDAGAHDRIIGAPKRAFLVDQSRRGIRSPATYLNLLKPLRRLYAESEDAAALGLTEEDLSRGCSACGGTGSIRTEMEFLPDILEECETCMGTGYSQEAWDVRLRGFSLPELNKLTLSQVFDLFRNEPQVADPIKAAIDVGLGYLTLRQPGVTLSGGEAQRLKIASELRKRTRDSALYILDEPTVGQHMEDIERLKRVLHRLVDEGKSVVVVEHNPSLLADCDWLIELGPEGGPRGGWLVAEGPPEQVAGMNTPTAKYIGLELSTP